MRGDGRVRLRAAMGWVVVGALACGPVGQDPASTGTSRGAVAVARFAGTQGRGIAPDTERFDGSGSYAEDQGAFLARCDWTFADGHTGTGCYITHVFDKPGHYTVRLTVTASDGGSGWTTLEVDVTAPNGDTSAEAR